jgi:hypothetical protein
MRALLLLVCFCGIATAAEGPVLPSIDGKRLFTTPSERAALDRVRAATEHQPVVERPLPRKVEVKPLPQVQLDGLVKRSSGEDTVWINGAEVEAGTRRGEVSVTSVRDGGNARILLSGKKALTLKPGQRFDPESGQVRDRVQVEKGR